MLNINNLVWVRFYETIEELEYAFVEKWEREPDIHVWMKSLFHMKNWEFDQYDLCIKNDLIILRKIHRQ